MNRLPSAEEMERASRERDPSYDGVFFLAVRTTGIFCRPSCPARKPRRENVEFFARAQDAVFAGYRPCKRCRPLHAAGAAPEWAERLLARVEADPSVRMTDADVRAMGVDPARARRFFLDRYGLTFHAYCRGRRLGGALAAMREGAPIDDVVFDHGYESHSGFREAFAKVFGAPPGRARATDCVVAGLAETPLGPMVVGATSEGVCLAEYASRRMLQAQVETLRRRMATALVPGDNEHLAALRAQLDAYFAGTRTSFDLPLVTPGTPFQERVWRELRSIPYGETWSYEALARRVGAPGAVRAVGTANGANRVAIVIPCHRVVRKNGDTGGYGGGKWRKLALLELERGVARGAAASLPLQPVLALD
jgi:AraC family transcriptional regulator of adaptative response/methylated-DNA-[protein]-cysteine methyltransferase